MTPWKALPPALVIFGAMTSMPLSAQGSGNEPWEQGAPLSADPFAMLNAAKAHPLRFDKGILDLLESIVISIDEQGACRRVTHSVYRIDGEQGVEAWSSISAHWKPWRQARPLIRGRVITPDGKAHLLDPETIGEFPVSEPGSKVFDDRKRIAARLPQLTVGAIIEVEIITQETAPLVQEGRLDWVDLSQSMPVLHTRLELSLPESVPVKYKLHGLPGIRPVRQTEKGRVRILVDLGPLEPQVEREPHQLPGTETPPAFSFSTAKSWSDFAKVYGQIVDRQIGTVSLEKLVKEAVGEAKEPREVIARLVARLHKDIRYTGIEFGEAAIVPRTPLETLKRGFGDCKDKACLLVAMLRQAGISAEVALLNTGWGMDVDPDLPGLELFDHAIAYLPGNPDLWIDATAEFAKPGELPYPDRGRWALVAGASTTKLIKTPMVKPEENLFIETREVFLAPIGRGRILETTSAQGPSEMSIRAQFGGGDPKKFKEEMEGYVRRAYGAKGLGVLEATPHRDLKQPFTLKLEALEAESAETWQNDAKVKLLMWPMLERFIQVVQESEAEAKAKKDEIRPRRTGLVFPEPFAVEWRYRIQMPRGFAPRPLFKDDVIPLGPASLSRAFQTLPDGRVAATFRFSSGKQVWTAAEVDTARAALKKLGVEDIQFLYFDQVGEAHLQAGRVKEALAEFNALAKAEPKDAGPMTRIARALLSAGLGEAAREEARRAASLDPKSALAQETLGWVLQHDLIGRRFEKGWDPEGAAGAYRKAKALAPSEWSHPANLAITLEHNAVGERYGNGAKLEEAIKEYRVVRDTLKADKMADNLLVCLGWAGHFKEVLELAASLPGSETINMWSLAARTCLEGPEAAMKQAAQSITNSIDLRKALINGADILCRMRRYPEGVALLRSAAAGMDQPGQIQTRIDIFLRTRRWEELPVDAKDPRALVRQLLVEAIGKEKSLEELATIFSEAMRDSLRGPEAWNRFKNQIGIGIKGFRNAGIPLPESVDVALGLAQLAVEGDEGRGYRVRMNPGTGDGTSYVDLFVSAEGGKLRIAATDINLMTYAREALRRLDRNDLVGARAWLDWAREGLRAQDGDDPLATRPFVMLWTRGQEANEGEIRRAALSLLCYERNDKATLERIRKAFEAATDEKARFALSLALANICSLQHDLDGLDSVNGPLLQANPHSMTAIRYRLVFLDERGRWAEGLALAEEQLKRLPENRLLSSYKARMLGQLGRAGDRENWYRSIIDGGSATTSELNSLAWSHLVRNKVDATSVEFSRRAVLMKTGSLAASQHTLASLLAEMGQVSEAREMILQELKTRGVEEPEGNEWYVFGRIAEHLGQSGAARACYKRVSPPEPGEPESESCLALARRRLGVMGKSR